MSIQWKSEFKNFTFERKLINNLNSKVTKPPESVQSIEIVSKCDLLKRFLNDLKYQETYSQEVLFGLYDIINQLRIIYKIAIENEDFSIISIFRDFPFSEFMSFMLTSGILKNENFYKLFLQFLQHSPQNVDSLNETPVFPYLIEIIRNYLTQDTISNNDFLNKLSLINSIISKSPITYSSLTDPIFESLKTLSTLSFLKKSKILFFQVLETFCNVSPTPQIQFAYLFVQNEPKCDFSIRILSIISKRIPNFDFTFIFPFIIQQLNDFEYNLFDFIACFLSILESSQIPVQIHSTLFSELSRIVLLNSTFSKLALPLAKFHDIFQPYITPEFTTKIFSMLSNLLYEDIPLYLHLIIVYWIPGNLEFDLPISQFFLEHIENIEITDDCIQGLQKLAVFYISKAELNIVSILNEAIVNLQDIEAQPEKIALLRQFL